MGAGRHGWFVVPACVPARESRKPITAHLYCGIWVDSFVIRVPHFIMGTMYAKLEKQRKKLGEAVSHEPIRSTMLQEGSRLVRRERV